MLNNSSLSSIGKGQLAARPAHSLHYGGAVEGDFNEILALAREAGMLITLDGQIGTEKYESIAGSLASFRRFANAMRTLFAEP
jgi:hypothetical protein